MKLAIVAATLALVGCASKPSGPAVKHVCIEAALPTPEETAYLKRRAASYLSEYGFAMSESQCEVTSKFSVFGGFQGEIVGAGLLGAFGVGNKGYWSIEGVHNVVYQGQKIVDDSAIELRRHESKQGMYDSLAWELVKPITRSFVPRSGI